LNIQISKKIGKREGRKSEKQTGGNLRKTNLKEAIPSNGVRKEMESLHGTQ